MTKKTVYRDNFMRQRERLKEIPVAKEILDSIPTLDFVLYFHFLDDANNLQEPAARELFKRLIPRAYPEQFKAAEALGLHQLPNKE